MSHHHHDHHEAGKNILLVFFLNLLFVVIEIIGAVLSQSISIASDAFHDLGDCLILLFAYILEKKSKNKSNDQYTFGYKKLSVFASFFTSLVLLLGSLFVIAHAVERLQNPQPVNGSIMFYLAIIGILINGLGIFKLLGSKKLVSKAIMLHLFEDVLGWIAILISSILITKFSWYMIDPILSICISIFIIYNAAKTLYASSTLLLDKVPDEINLNQIRLIFSDNNNIKEIEKLRVWSLDEETVNLTITCLVDENISIKQANEIKSEIALQLKEYNFHEITIQFK